MRFFKPTQLFAVRTVRKKAHSVVFNGAHNQKMDAIEEVI
jgi:hypothetical protein